MNAAATVKVRGLATLGFILVAVIGGRGAWAAPVFAVLTAALILAWARSGVSLRRSLGRVARLEPFALGAATLALWAPDGPRLFALALVRATLCLGALVLLTETTPFSALLNAGRAARVPALFLTTLALLERYRFVLTDEGRRMRTARRARTFAAVPRRRAIWRTLTETLAGLFVRALARSERIYAAMCARGWR